MSNQSIVISERDILHSMDEMCAQSLDHVAHDAWEKVKEQLLNNRARINGSPCGVVSKSDLITAFEKYFSQKEPISYNGVTDVIEKLVA